ncbi:hypothetical protein F0U61_46180 [Archangium violaceum]|uniref:hypothetical protein n=1 Tax=Archangium violaceum TaxID=83451 RepID=UPI002B305FC6|nr:hypothetical protein F0U61_46180 [Archangium violaceum]
MSRHCVFDQARFLSAISDNASRYDTHPFWSRSMALTVERDGQPLRIRYTPRGAPVPGKRVPGVPDAACKL